VGVIDLFKVVEVQDLRLTETSTHHFWAMNTYQVQTTFAQGAKCARSAAFVGAVKGEGLRFAWKRPKLGRRDTAFRSRFVGRGYL
jgi:hypothetical protein